MEAKAEPLDKIEETPSSGLDHVADFELKCLLEHDALRTKIRDYFLRKLLDPQSTERMAIELNYPEVIIRNEKHEKANPSLLTEHPSTTD